MSPRLATLAALAALFTTAGAAADWISNRPNWEEIAWPFPRDAWPGGRAFRCTSRACGGLLEVAIRPKLGFCNCTTGVTGDSEVDAISDLDKITDNFVPKEAGEQIVIDGMPGRVRAYALHLPDGSQRNGAGFAVSRRCDVVVAASQGTEAGSHNATRAIANLIESKPLSEWLRAILGQG